MADQYIGQVLADKYRVESVIREDGLGRIYRAAHLLMDKPVAVKILPAPLALDDENVRQFTAEVRTLARLSHPNVPIVTDYGTDKNGTVFIVSEIGIGETLKNAVRREGAFTLEHANRVAQQIASALSAAHANGIVHQNLNSENVFLAKSADGADFVKVLDFGAVSLNGNEATAVEYRAPEQFSDRETIDARSDIYALGVILYEMLAGEVPFTGETADEIKTKHEQEPPLPLSAFRDDLPGEIDLIVQRALAKIPENRFQTAKGFADELNRAVVFSSRAAGENSAIHAAALADKPQNNIWKTAFIVLAGIAVLSGFFIYMTQVKQTNPATVLQTDANGSPVQPLNPATGASEQSLSNMGAFAPTFDANTNTLVQPLPQVAPGGDGYDPWARGGMPPPGAPPAGPIPQYVPPTGQYYDGNVNPNSPFMAADGNVYVMVPKNANTNVNTQPKGKTSPTPAANTAAPNEPKASPTPAANTAAPTQPKATPQPKNTKPTEQPKTEKPAAKPSPGGQTQEG
jgi:serine/threonine protein kinase